MSTHNEKELKRSIESLRDWDCQAWQLVLYPSSMLSKHFVLRIVGYPGQLRMAHPTNPRVRFGITESYLKDITQKSHSSIKYLDDSVAEFDMSPFINELDKKRSLRLSLPGVINDLLIPPYLVYEWRLLIEQDYG